MSSKYWQCPHCLKLYRWWEDSLGCCEDKP